MCDPHAHPQDELHVTDVADAMILSRLLEVYGVHVLWKVGVAQALVS